MTRNRPWLFLSAVLMLLLATWNLAAQETLPPAQEGSFSVVVLPDTQAYKGKGTKAEPDSEAEVTNAVFDAYTKWISDNIEPQRIVFVSHVGDIVDKNVPEQWEVARRAMDRFHGRLPYGISVGNHDMASNGDSSLFQRYFPESRFNDFTWYGGSFRNEGDDQSISGNNANSFQLFSASPVKVSDGGLSFRENPRS